MLSALSSTTILTGTPLIPSSISLPIPLFSSPLLATPSLPSFTSPLLSIPSKTFTMLTLPLTPLWTSDSLPIATTSSPLPSPPTATSLLLSVASLPASSPKSAVAPKTPSSCPLPAPKIDPNTPTPPEPCFHFWGDWGAHEVSDEGGGRDFLSHEMSPGRFC